jgi:hypothetical protein
MTLWFWLGAGFAIGLLALIILIRIINRPVDPLPAAQTEPSMAELVRTQMKVAILQDRLERAATEFEYERAARDQALQLRLAATEAAYQRQMVAMQPRLYGAVAETTPVQINIRVEAGTVAAAPKAPEPLTGTTIDPQKAFLLMDSAAPLLETKASAADHAEQGLAPSQTVADTDDETAAVNNETEPLTEGEQRDGVAAIVETQAALPVTFAQEEMLADSDVVEDPLLLAAPVVDSTDKIAVPPVESIAQDTLLEPPISEPGEYFAAPLSSALGEIEDVILDEASVARFLAVAGGAVEDPYDGIEPAAQPIPVAHDEPPAIPDAPLDDLDELPELGELSVATHRRIVPPWQDELDADFADDEEWTPLATVTAVESDVTPRASASRWEVLPRQEEEMANLDYLDSGVFAVPALPGWGKDTAVVALPHESPSRTEAAPSSEPLPDPADALSWLDDLDEEAPLVAKPVDEAALIEARVAEILAGDPAAIAAESTVLTAEEEEWATVAAILARGVEAGVVDLGDETVTTGAADEAAQTAAGDPEPAFDWQRRPISWDALYFDNIKLTGEPVLVRQDREIDFDWGPQAPAAGIPAGQFSVRWNGVLVLDPGLYHFTLHAPDGIRLWLNERLVLSAWYDQSLQEYAREFDWQGGSLYVRCEHYEHGPEAQIHFTWERIA